MTDLKDKVAIITGSTSGIGEAMAKLLSENQVKVVVNSMKSVEKGEALSKNLYQSIYCQADIESEMDCKKLIESTISHYGRLDFLINNASRLGRSPCNKIEDISDEFFKEMLTGNVVSTWSLIRHAIPFLKKSGDGAIVNITSCAGDNPGAVSSAIPYAVSKAALNYLTKLLAKELGPEIRVNGIAPGVILTGRTENFHEAIEKFKTRTPLKRLGKPQDIAEIL